MCTVSYVPLGPGNFILTSNRDENPQRVTLEPGKSTTLVEAETIIAPKDTKAGGSWIAMSAHGKVACLLNGAFVKHQHEPPYRKSRGLVLLDYFSFSTAIEYHNKADLQGIENFTLLMLENGMLYELRWDGQEKFFAMKEEDEPHLWSSCTLYDAETASNKEQKFLHWMEDHEKPTAAELAFFHGLNNPDGFLLELPMVKTVSITTVHKTAADIRMDYYDLLTAHNVEKTVRF